MAPSWMDVRALSNGMANSASPDTISASRNSSACLQPKATVSASSANKTKWENFIKRILLIKLVFYFDYKTTTQRCIARRFKQ